MTVNPAQFNRTQFNRTQAQSVVLPKKTTQGKGLNLRSIILVVLSVVALGVVGGLYGAGIITFPVTLLLCALIGLVQGVIKGIKEALEN